MRSCWPPLFFLISTRLWGSTIPSSRLSVGEALSALLPKYLDCVVATHQQEIEAFVGNFVPRSRVKEAVNALLNARELTFTHIGNRSLLQIAPPKAGPSERTADSTRGTLS